jgi:hypothetical protein
MCACVQNDLDEFGWPKGGGAFTEILHALKNDQKTKKKGKEGASVEDVEVVCVCERECVCVCECVSVCVCVDGCR